MKPKDINEIREITMDWEKELYDENEKPLDRLVEGYSNTSIFRKIAFVGDSLSSGEFERVKEDGKKDFHDMYEYSWGQHIARRNGLTAYSFSKGGMTAKEYCESFAEEKGFWAKEKACQAYVIALGVNDIYNSEDPNVDIGTKNDVDVKDYRNNKKNFIGYYAQIVSRYKEIVPDAKFFFVGPPRETIFPRPEHQTRGIMDALYGLCNIFDNCYVIDLYAYGPLYDMRFYRHYWLHTHLNPMGYVLTAKLVDSYIDYIIRHNPEDFKNVGFIGTGIGYGFEAADTEKA